ncbi:hypothetical protein H0H93_013091 [Arthromyces matolae]|nr:hypothetical protein H0H93_013091 [Arthromyces matolae]
MSVAAPQIASSGSRSRPQARRKPNDDASYFGPTGSSGTGGVKRQAGDKADGEPRGKRKRVETSAINSARRDVGGDEESKTSLVEFCKMPTPVLYKYLVQFDIVPHVRPSPLTAEDPAPPSALENYNYQRQMSHESTPPVVTPANRPRRDGKDQNRRRSSRLSDEPQSRTPILADVDELHTVLAGIVERHFNELPTISGREEVDTFSEVLLFPFFLFKYAMKFSIPTLVALIPLISQATAISVPRLYIRSSQQFNQNGGNFRGNKHFGGNKTTVSASATAAATTTTSTAAAAASTAAAATNSTADSSDPQTSLTLDPRVIATGFADDGQDVPAAGQVPSLTSTNNFINFCLTVPNLPITNGKQITTGSCNPAPIGTIPSVDNMPSAKFTFPKNGGTVSANSEFTISMAINNLETGNFVNAQENYFAAPQQLNAQGLIVGHSHVVVEAIDSIDTTTPTDPRKFAFFKGLNSAAVNGLLTADVTAGVPAGAYRLCSINTSANHQPAIVPVAQHGSLDDCIYFTATDDGAAAATGAAAAAAATDSATAAVAASTSDVATATSAAAATATSKSSTSKNKNNNKSSGKHRRYLSRL